MVVKLLHKVFNYFLFYVVSKYIFPIFQCLYKYIVKSNRNSCVCFLCHRRPWIDVFSYIFAIEVEALFSFRICSFTRIHENLGHISK
jgi:hypothetical protein